MLREKNSEKRKEYTQVKPRLRTSGCTYRTQVFKWLSS